MAQIDQQELMNIVTFQPEYAQAFNLLNRAWLDGYGLYEDEDGKYLDHPQEMILDKGGEIFFALIEGEVIGTCAVIPHGENTVELAKLAVAARFQGRGLGRKLSETAIDWARQRHYPKIFLISSSKLGPALALYERLGFAYGSLPDDISYQTADVYMELSLT